jgi:two-component system sensor histidine kinase/response regulator
MPSNTFSMHHSSVILLVDDRPENLFALESILSDSHRLLLNATSGVETLLMTELEDVDLILLDYRLGDMTGIEVIRKLRARAATTRVPVLLVTAADEGELPSLSEFEVGSVDILRKPLDVEEVQSMVNLYEEMALLRKEVQPGLRRMFR